MPEPDVPPVIVPPDVTAVPPDIWPPLHFPVAFPFPLAHAAHVYQHKYLERCSLLGSLLPLVPPRPLNH